MFLQVLDLLIKTGMENMTVGMKNLLLMVSGVVMNGMKE